MRHAIEDVQFWAQVLGDSKRTLVVNPDLESRAVQMARANGVADLVRVVANPHCPPETAYWIDEQAAEASMRQAAMKFTFRGAL